MTEGTIVCRAKRSKSCYHGKPEDSIYPDGMEDDGTFDGSSVVCDPCYMAGGMPSLPMGDFPSREEVVEHVDRQMGIEK